MEELEEKVVGQTVNFVADAFEFEEVIEPIEHLQFLPGMFLNYSLMYGFAINQ